MVETTGAFRSERLFILARIRPHAQKQTEAKFYRASELYFTLSSASDPQELKDFLPENEFRIIGRNSNSEELIIQTKNFTPKRLKEILLNYPKKPDYREYPPSRICAEQIINLFDQVLA